MSLNFYQRKYESFNKVHHIICSFYFNVYTLKYVNVLHKHIQVTYFNGIIGNTFPHFIFALTCIYKFSNQSCAFNYYIKQ